MATSIGDIPKIKQQISDQQKQADTLQGNLNASPTALGGDGTPTSTDISNQESLQRIQGTIQTLNDQKLKTQWYGTDVTTNPSTEGQNTGSAGLIGTGLDLLQRPLRGVVGAVKHVIGQGSGSLYQDVADNMVRNKNTFGDVLKGNGVPWAVAAPLGFALDVGMDPVNWLTMGSEALVPRLAVGAFKGFTSGEGIVEGLSAAAKSGVMEKAANVGRFIPYLKDTDIFANFGASTLDATNAFQKITGETAENVVIKGANYRNGFKSVIDKVANVIPGGQNILENFKYDPANWIRDARIKDIFQEASGGGIDTGHAIAANLRGESLEPYLKQASEEASAKILTTPIGKPAFDINLDANATPLTNKEVDQKIAALARVGMDKKMASEAPNIIKGVDDASQILKDPTPYISGDPYENAARIASEQLGGSNITMEDVKKIVNSGALDQTGVKWYDSMMKSIKDFGSKTDAAGAKIPGIGKAVMDKYDQAMGIFRAFKVGASPTAWMNATVGEAAMTHMALGGISPELLARWGQSAKLYSNQTDAAAFIDNLLMNAGRDIYGDSNVIRKGLAESPTAAKGLFGDISFLGSTDNAKLLLQQAVDAGIATSDMKPEDLAPSLQKAIEELSQVKMEAGDTPVRDLLSTGEKVNPLDMGTEMNQNEMFTSSATRRMLDYVKNAAKADPSNPAWKFLDFTLNNMPSGYTKLHQGFKMGTFLYATTDGLTMSELKLASRLVDINPEDLTKIAVDARGNKIAQVAGEGAKGIQYRYAVSPRAAMDLTNSIYVNYSAMPAAIKVLRNMPLLGSPFISFTYAMAMKTGQTLAYNPAAFNKISFALNDFGGTKNPLEKKALNTQFYEYLKQPAMFRMPFFDKNPIYVNMSSMLPYYSLNMFNPSDANYTGGTWNEALANVVQKSPILKDPVGSTIYSYLIQPMILGQAIAPQGEFGQPLFPLDANALTKTGYGLRALGEAFVPNVASYAGLLTPEAAANFIPSYRWRQLSYAKSGKNQLGISSKEPAVSRTIRSLLQTTGIPVESPVNTTFNQANKSTAP